MDSYLKSLFSKTPSYSSLSGLKGTTPTLSLTPPKKATTPVTSNAPASASPMYPTPTGAPIPAQNTAKSQYVSSQVKAPTPAVSTPQLGTPEYTQYLMNKAQSLGMNTGASTPAMTPPAPIQAPAPAPDPVASYLESYRDYLSQYADSLKPSDELKAARSRLGEIQSKIDERSLKARRDYEATLDTPGGTVGGAQQSATQLNRRYASELADLGVAESGAARGLSALTGEAEATSSAYKTAMELSKPLQIGDNYYDPKTGQLIPSSKAKEGFSLSEGQARYELNPQTGQYEKIASVPKTTASGGGVGGGTYVPGANPTVDSWATRIQKGLAKITDIPASQAGLRNSVMNALAEMGDPSMGMSDYQSERATRTVQSVDELMKKADENPGIFGRSAIAPIPGFLRSDDFRNFAAELDTLKASIAFGELTAMREASKTGGALGQVSNIELGLLESALGALRMDQSPENFKQQLQKVKDSIERWRNASSGMSASGTGGAPQQMQLPDGTILNLQADGTYE